MRHDVCLQAYQAALAIYELPTAYMIISASQKDPAEHLAELRTFMAAPAGPLRRFAINKRLLRHTCALECLVEAGAEHAGQAREYAKQHGLLRVLVAWLTDTPELRAAAMTEYAQARCCFYDILAAMHSQLCWGHARPVP